MKKAAEILVECGYADSYLIDKREHLQHNPPITMVIHDTVVDGIRFECDPFSDTLEGRRQADVIEDWLNNNNQSMWLTSGIKIKLPKGHQWRLDRIKWCLEQLNISKSDGKVV